MELLVNDLSLAGQLHDLAAFRAAMHRMLEMRSAARRFGRELYCHRNMTSAQVTKDLAMPQAVGALSRDERGVVTQWLTRQGPFWDDTRLHSSDDYFECFGTVVTDTAAGEAAYSCYRGAERRLVSFVPSPWDFTPLGVEWFRDNTSTLIEVQNHWDALTLEAALEAAPVALTSWAGVQEVTSVRCRALTFLPDAFDYLSGYPFVRSAAERIVVLLDTLNRLRMCVDASGNRTNEGHALYHAHFTGEKAWFSDSSATEQRVFQKQLTFRNTDGALLFCPWHGKVKTPQIRIHFTWPVSNTDPLFVVYVGPKITRQ